MRLLFLVFLIPYSAHAALSTSGSLVEEVLSESKDPHAWDWRNYKVQIEAGVSTNNEANVFEATSYHIGASRPLGGRWLVRGAARRVITTETASSRALSLTPFSQAALPSRYEFLAGAGYTLLEGRSATALTPTVTDIGHALYALAGIQYNLFDSNDPEPVPGMRALYYKLALEVGLRFQIFLPENLGLAFEWTYSRAATNADPDLDSWQRVGGSLSWSFY